eukprot:gene12379-15567_t
MSLTDDIFEFLKTGDNDLEFDLFANILNYQESFKDVADLFYHIDNNTESLAVEEEEGTTGTGTGGEGAKKKRSRNADQMAMNRQAQRQYRERKKHEQHGLQNAIDLMAAQLAAMKTMEAGAKELELQNITLLTETAQQQLRIQDLELQVSEQHNVIEAQQAQAAERTATLAKTQKMILDQHERLQFQADVIESLKDKLKDSVEKAWECMSNTSPEAVCKKMHEAVRTALEDAKDVDGLQETLGNLPDHIVVEICKNILHSCKDMWPQMVRNYESRMGPSACHTSVGHLG